MGGLFGGNQQDTSQRLESTKLGPYPDDNPVRMPAMTDQQTMRAARKKRDAITSRSGRVATRLAADKPAGTRSYGNSFLGSVG